jgi:predicted CoA-binding protein
MSEEKDNEFVPPPNEIKKILKESKVVAIEGLSDDRMRASNRVGKFLKLKGYEIIPVNPKYDTVLGLKSYSSLSEIPREIDIVDIFRKSEAVMGIVEEAIKKKVKVIWMQEGVMNHEAARKAREAGIKVVMDRCMYKEYDKHYMKY